LKHEALNEQDGREHDHGSGRAEEDSDERAPDEVPARSSGDRKVEHLSGEDERAADTEQGDVALVELFVSAVAGEPEGGTTEGIERRKHGPCQEVVGDMH